MERARANRQTHTKDRGFTLIEVLAALMFLAILVPAIVSALSVSSRVSSLSDRRAVAVELAENQLNTELMNTNGTPNWESGSATTGDFGADYPGYKWELTQGGWSGDSVNNMTELAIEVTFPVQGRDQKVRLTTLVSATVASAQSTGTNQGTSTATPTQ